ncbi:hypothetical protein [Streptomyces sp. NPDC090445]|uniref:hypothetical protein n=1 Tax=Streptomyces sp. NPDC090445 TaxID=3365963 RepID=UPI00381B50CE
MKLSFEKPTAYDLGPDADLGMRLAELLGPDADWRANGHAAYRESALGNVTWTPVTGATFDAAVVGIGNGRAVVVVATDED